MDDIELEKLLKDIESDRVERKESISDGDKIRQAICAFANDLPGYGKEGVLFIGADDQGRTTGLEISDQLLQILASMRSDGNILPIPTMTVQKRSIGGRDVAVVMVQPADAPPVRFKGTVWVRVGPRRSVASPQDERILAERRRHRDIPRDIQPLRDADVDELDLDLFRSRYLPAAVSPEVLAANIRTLTEQMASLGLVEPGPPPVPTVLGMLLIGKDPFRWLPMAWIGFLRLAGEDLASEVLTSHDFKGPMPRQMERLDELLHLHVMTAVDITSGPLERRYPDYPIPAIQQIIRNAVMHRIYEGTNAPVRIYWFSDRIQVISPGGPYGRVTAENFGEPGIIDYRNPNLAAAMRCLGYAQHFGVGIQIAREAMERNGNPPLEFKVDSRTVVATLRWAERKRR
ncbi:MAG: putative DNA binding domain-containing protein [Elusimicrobia bacterium]|nr:putative DNA binding domain-containing protein [Elusimicrobiota bacterium]